MKTFIMTLTLCFSAQIFAREITLATITGNVDTDTSYFYAEIDDAGKLDTVRFKTVTKTGKITQDDHYPVDTVDATGVTLLVRDGRDILKLQTVRPFSFENGGEVKLSYLYSGVNNSWKTLKVKLVKVGEDFQIQNQSGSVITKFFVKGNRKPIIGLVGISELVPRP